MDTQLDCRPDALRAARPAAEAPTLPPLPEGWVCGRRCDVGGPVDHPVTVDLVLMHPRAGIALIDLTDTTQDAEGFLRERLEETGFDRIFNGHLPIVHGTLQPADLPRLIDLLAVAFADLAPLTIGGGEAWVRTLERTIVPGDRVWTDNLEGRPRGWRADDAEEFEEIPAEPAPPRTSRLAALGRPVLEATAALRGALRTPIRPAVDRVTVRTLGLLADGIDAARNAADGAGHRPWRRWALLGTAGLAALALVTANLSGGPAEAPAAPPVAAAPAPAVEPLAAAAPAPEETISAAGAAGIATVAALAAVPAVQAMTAPAPRAVSFSPPRPTVAEGRREARRARRSAARQAQAPARTPPREARGR
ncbi:hypothetical protein EAH89_15375 [Roseomonas nepalensis]|uniref:Uncharacterized protein n=1 Tax=Muricoccus nepalensis TaxID=1854500 RepID=A0A502FWL7_9PROT|nr:hypothetical protein [Roseomonas nepalensis]TPG53821.1 hypothetical protein EAH89_15375 [Roseomonas nepalensis]